VGDDLESSERRAVGGEMESCGRCFDGDTLGVTTGLLGGGCRDTGDEAPPEAIVSGRWYVAMKRSLVVSLGNVNKIK
jgi:hypothetical protein